MFLFGLDTQLITMFLPNPRKERYFGFFFLSLAISEPLGTEWHGSHGYILMGLRTAWGNTFLKLEVHSFESFFFNGEVHWFLIVIVFLNLKIHALHFLLLYFLIDKATVVMLYKAVSVGPMHKTRPRAQKLSWLFQSGMWCDTQDLTILWWYSAFSFRQKSEDFSFVTSEKVWSGILLMLGLT